MKVDFPDRYVVSPGFRLGKYFEYIQRDFSRIPGHVCGCDDLTDFLHAPVMMALAMGMLPFRTMRMVMHVIMRMVMRMVVHVIVRMVMRMVVHVIVRVVVVIMLLLCCVFMSMEILHIMIVSIYLSIQDYIKVACIDSRFLNTADFGLKALHRQACKYPLQHLLVSSKVQKSCHCHISADSGIAFQI